MSRSEDIISYAGEEHQVDYKPTIGDKVSGSIEQAVGKITKNPDKVTEGQAKKTGHPTDQGHHVDAHDHGVEDKDSLDHARESPHLSPSERSPVNPNSEGNLNTSTDGAHHVHDSVHAANIPPPPPATTNPYVIDQSATATLMDNAAAQKGTSHQATNIPLPPSHQNSFANYTPTTPGEGGNPSSGYIVHGGLPSAGQGHSDVGLGQGGVADRNLFPPAHTQQLE
ncbi:hypothetical protein L486_05651 [Kwoniella mangroviensis CBS 10435]|uniref:Uncharacterized protein n=1 Tax=Kwoniella mangroviensis CBS 10435 TaxID=1331196 RepID=A0A1B9IMG8_9TREE|nr:uncharacterized protein I203_07297 [Kwoniella mangroviensis CBS 8507]OCF56796.1 hypothetical protein L486_05651 [Kwoniella mangroviensis CBS 10435]OCF63599.1 hypothetical protein I203_07297 [Kwoniella mangroviensis CBS 8507]OCF75366.1 hypothetical protein I204_04221 [Kwoniella mangroviensis CBS 8886]